MLALISGKLCRFSGTIWKVVMRFDSALKANEFCLHGTSEDDPLLVSVWRCEALKW